MNNSDRSVKEERKGRIESRCVREGMEKDV